MEPRDLYSPPAVGLWERRCPIWPKCLIFISLFVKSCADNADIDIFLSPLHHSNPIQRPYLSAVSNPVTQHLNIDVISSDFGRYHYWRLSAAPQCVCFNHPHKSALSLVHHSSWLATELHCMHIKEVSHFLRCTSSFIIKYFLFD